MLETAELGSTVSKEEYKQAMPQLRVGLINAQYDLRKAGFKVVVLLAGSDRAGIEQVVRALHEWMDARYMLTSYFGKPTDEEKERPAFWRYWRRMPAHGRAGIFVGAWAQRPILREREGKYEPGGFEQALGRARRFERQLADDGALVLKFWLHLPKKEFRKRLKKAEKDPEELFWVSDQDREIFADYDKILPLAEQYLRRTSTDQAPWTLVESTDARYAKLTAGRALLGALEARLQQPPPVPPPPAAAQTADYGQGALQAVDLGAAIEQGDYKQRLEELQRSVHRLSLDMRKKRRTVILVFEGWDAAGKGGCIRRITGAMSGRDFLVVPIGAPTDEEKAHHYLWRFWRLLPPGGKTAIFDRSWYGRVLVERVEGFAREDEWRRAFEEINDFEGQLVDHRMPVCKFWLHIDSDEQLRRFKAREQTPFKKYKLSEEDFRNRDKWPAYETAVNEMVARTSTEIAPWHLVPANDKRYARIQVLEATVAVMEAALEGRPRD